jgi:hypothetical protein
LENTGKPAQAMPPFTTLLPNGIIWVTGEENPKVFDLKNPSIRPALHIHEPEEKYELFRAKAYARNRLYIYIQSGRSNR